jgi:hypothetical protein
MDTPWKRMPRSSKKQFPATILSLVAENQAEVGRNETSNLISGIGS